MSTVINADVIAVVKDGNFAEIGNHETLLAKDGVYSKLVARQIKRSKNKITSDGGAEERAVDLTIDALLSEETGSVIAGDKKRVLERRKAGRGNRNNLKTQEATKCRGHR